MAEDDPFAAIRPVPAVAVFRGRKIEGLPFFPASEFDGQAVADRAWLVPDMIPSGDVTLLSGDGGAGKSLLALQLAVAVATGTEWLGRKVASGRVLFLAAEDDRAELHRRLIRIASSAGIALSDLDRLELAPMAGRDVVMAAPGASGRLEPTAIAAQIEAHIADASPALVVLDTLADLFGGHENDRAQVRAFVQMVRAWALRHGAAVLMLSHPSVEGMRSGTGLSGSTAWNGSVRARLYLVTPKTSEGMEIQDARTLSVQKSNYGPRGAEFSISWSGGVFVGDASEGALDRGAASARAVRVFINLLRLFAESGRDVSANPGSTFAPTTFAKHPECEGVTAVAFRAAMETLIREGRVVSVNKGTEAKPRWRLSVAGGAP